MRLFAIHIPPIPQIDHEVKLWRAHSINKLLVLKKRYDRLMIYKLYGALPRPLRRLISQTIHPRFLVGVIAIVSSSEGKILLLYSPYKKAWSLPEGFLKKGEHPYKAIIREILEETGATAEIVSIAGIPHLETRPMLDIVFNCRLNASSLVPDNVEVTKIQFFAPNSLPEDMVKTHRDYVKRYLP